MSSCQQHGNFRAANRSLLHLFKEQGAVSHSPRSIVVLVAGVHEIFKRYNLDWLRRHIDMPRQANANCVDAKFKLLAKPRFSGKICMDPWRFHLNLQLESIQTQLCNYGYIISPIYKSVPVTITETEAKESFKFHQTRNGVPWFGSAIAKGVETTYKITISLETVRKLTLQKPPVSYRLLSHLLLSGSWKFGPQKYGIEFQKIDGKKIFLKYGMKQSNVQTREPCYTGSCFRRCSDVIKIKTTWQLYIKVFMIKEIISG